MLYGLVFVTHLASVVLAGPLVATAPVQQPQLNARQTLFDKRLGVWVADGDDGVEILQILPRTGAGALREGDVLIAFNGERLQNVAQFRAFVDETPFGEEVQLDLLRRGERRQVPAKLDAAEIYRRMAPFVSGLKREGAFLRMLPAGGAERVGVEVQSLTPQLADYFGTQGGVLVSVVRPSSPADRAGVRAGDVITAVDAQVVKTPSDFERALRRDLSGTKLTLRFTRDREKRTVEVPVSNYRP
jgi:serine protease Do